MQTGHLHALNHARGNREELAQTELQADALRVAEEDAGLILPDGTLTIGPANWGGPPHFFRKQRVIVIYVGDDQIVLDLLTELLGSQFAGG